MVGNEWVKLSNLKRSFRLATANQCVLWIWENVLRSGSSSRPRKPWKVAGAVLSGFFMTTAMGRCKGFLVKVDESLRLTFTARPRLPPFVPAKACLNYPRDPMQD